MVLVLLLLSVLQSAATIKLAPKIVGEVDRTKVNGLMRQLAWSPDGGELYLQTYEPNNDATVKALFHFMISPATAAVKKLDHQPAWAMTYIAWKAAKAAPDDSAFEIELAVEKKRLTATATPMAGDLAKGGSDTSGTTVEAAVEAAQQSQLMDVYTMRLKGEVVGEWINHPTIPGLTFGWGPAGTGLIAFSDQKSGRLVIMDKTGAKRRIAHTKGVVAPAWSLDGNRLAYLEARSRDKYVLVIADVRKANVTGSRM